MNIGTGKPGQEKTKLNYSKTHASRTVAEGFLGGKAQAKGLRRFILATSLLAVACRPLPARDRSGEAVARRAIEQAVAEYVSATNRGDAGALAELYTDDAILLPPEDTLVRGRKGIEAFWSQGMEHGLALEPVRLEVHGDAALFIARYHLPATADATADSGKCAMSFARQQDGIWKLTADIWNGDSPADDSTDDEGSAAPIAPIT